MDRVLLVGLIALRPTHTTHSQGVSAMPRLRQLAGRRPTTSSEDTAHVPVCQISCDGDFHFETAARPFPSALRPARGLLGLYDVQPASRRVIAEQLRLLQIGRQNDAGAAKPILSRRTDMDGPC